MGPVHSSFERNPPGDILSPASLLSASILLLSSICAYIVAPYGLLVGSVVKAKSPPHPPLEKPLLRKSSTLVTAFESVQEVAAALLPLLWCA